MAYTLYSARARKFSLQMSLHRVVFVAVFFVCGLGQADQGQASPARSSKKPAGKNRPIEDSRIELLARPHVLRLLLFKSKARGCAD